MYSPADIGMFLFILSLQVLTCACEHGFDMDFERPLPDFALPPPDFAFDENFQPGSLTSADIDDNLNFDFYLDWSGMQMLSFYDLSSRITVSVTDQDDTPFSCSKVEVSLEQDSLEPVTSYTATNGLLYFFPKMYTQNSDAVWSLSASDSDGLVAATVSTGAVAGTTVNLKVDAVSSLPSKLDLMFVIDTTGSMMDELAYLKDELGAILERVQRQMVDVSLNLGLIMYRDHGDNYVVKEEAWTDSVSQMQATLSAQSAEGGGDFPEAMDEALTAAVNSDGWREGNVARVMFLMADAPPHDANLQQAVDSVKVAQAKGIKIYGLAASGVDDQAEYIMRFLAAASGARYTWLTDDSGYGNSHAEPKVQCYQVTSLNSMINRILVSQLTGTRVEAMEEDVIREDGSQEGGVCVVEITTTEPPAEEGDKGDDILIEEDGKKDGKKDGESSVEVYSDSSGGVSYAYSGGGRGSSSSSISSASYSTTSFAMPAYDAFPPFSLPIESFIEIPTEITIDALTTPGEMVVDFYLDIDHSEWEDSTFEQFFYEWKANFLDLEIVDMRVSDGPVVFSVTVFSSMLASELQDAIVSSSLMTFSFGEGRLLDLLVREPTPEPTPSLTDAMCSGLRKKKCKKTDGCTYSSKKCKRVEAVEPSPCIGLNKRKCKKKDGCAYTDGSCDGKEV